MEEAIFGDPLPVAQPDPEEQMKARVLSKAWAPKAQQTLTWSRRKVSVQTQVMGRRGLPIFCTGRAQKLVQKEQIPCCKNWRGCSAREPNQLHPGLNCIVKPLAPAPRPPERKVLTRRLVFHRERQEPCVLLQLLWLVMCKKIPFVCVVTCRQAAAIRPVANPHARTKATGLRSAEPEQKSKCCDFLKL